MKKTIIPPYLKEGDTVAIVGLACKVNLADIQPAINYLTTVWKVAVLIGDSVGASYNQFAGNDQVRANDFQQMLDNPAVKAIFSVRGGYGSSRIIDVIDFTSFVNNPKWVIGFSDITAVLCHIYQLGFESIHGVMPKLFLQDGGQESVESLRKVLFGEGLNYQVDSHELNRLGQVEAPIVGGNLAIMNHLLASPSELDTTNKILFLEDVGEYLYSIDRMMIQLKRAGKLSNLAGLVVGSFSDLKDNDTPFGKTAYQIIQEAVADYHYPVCYGFPVGHEPQNWAIPCGRKVLLTVSEANARISSLVF